jgi:hypothetical protein
LPLPPTRAHGRLARCSRRRQGAKRASDPQPLVAPRPHLPQHDWTLAVQAALDRSIGGGESTFVDAPYILQYIIRTALAASKSRDSDSGPCPWAMSIFIPTPHSASPTRPNIPPLPPLLPKEPSLCCPQLKSSPFPLPRAPNYQPTPPPTASTPPHHPYHPYPPSAPAPPNSAAHAPSGHNQRANAKTTTSQPAPALRPRAPHSLGARVTA